MKNSLKKLSLSSKNLRYKLVISFALTSVIPILVSLHLFWNYILREEGAFNFNRGAFNAGLLILISSVIAFLGFYFLGRRIIASIVNLNYNARIITDGDFSKRIDINGEEDELADLGVSLKRMSSQIQNDNLLREKVKELEMRDGVTGLYNEKYIRERFDEEIRRAILYQRPCSFALLNIGGFKEYAREYGKSRGEEVLKKAAVLLGDNAEEVDKVGRFEEELFAVILFEKNKGEANKIMRRLKEVVKEGLGIEGLTLDYGLSANPVDGENAEELIAEAKKDLENG